MEARHSTGPHIVTPRRPANKITAHNRHEAGGSKRNVELFFNFLGQPLIIVIEERNPLTCCVFNASVSRAGTADALVQFQHAQTRITDPTQCSAGGWVRSVNDDHDFEILVGLTKRASNRTQYPL